MTSATSRAGRDKIAAEITLAVLMRPFAVGWDRQRGLRYGSRALRIE
jgi:hypothetical protein